MELILFLNKCDLLDAKLKSGIRLSKYVRSFGERNNDSETAQKCEFFLVAIGRSMGVGSSCFSLTIQISGVNSMRFIGSTLLGLGSFMAIVHPLLWVSWLSSYAHDVWLISGSIGYDDYDGYPSKRYVMT